MPSPKPDETMEKYKDYLIKADSYFVRSMALLPQHTYVKLGTYDLAAAPAWVSLSEIRVLLVLSTAEQANFSKFLNTTIVLVLFFDSGDPRKPIRFHLRMSFLALEPLPGRDTVCMARFRFKLVPQAWTEILEPYFHELDFTLNQAQNRAEQWVKLPGPCRLLAKGLDQDARISEITALKVKISLPPLGEDFGKVSLKFHPKDSLPFLVEVLTPEGFVPSTEEQVLDLAFSPEFCSYLEPQYRSGGSNT